MKPEKQQKRKEAYVDGFPHSLVVATHCFGVLQSIAGSLTPLPLPLPSAVFPLNVPVMLPIVEPRSRSVCGIGPAATAEARKRVAKIDEKRMVKLRGPQDRY